MLLLLWCNRQTRRSQKPYSVGSNPTRSIMCYDYRYKSEEYSTCQQVIDAFALTNPPYQSGYAYADRESCCCPIDIERFCNITQKYALDDGMRYIIFDTKAEVIDALAEYGKFICNFHCPLPPEVCDEYGHPKGNTQYY